MGRKSIPKSEKKCPVSSRVSPAVKTALDTIATRERRNVSQVIEFILERSVEITAELNGKGKRRAK